MMRLKVFYATAVAVSVFASCSKQSYRLAFNPTPGAKYKVSMQTNSNTIQEMGGQNLSVAVTTEMDLRYEIENGDTNRTAIKVVFENMKTSQVANGQEFKMDTDNLDTSNAGAMMMKAMMGSEFLISVDKKGMVQEVNGMDAMMNKLMPAIQSKDAMMQVQLLEGMKNFMNDEILKNMVEQGFNVFPDKEMKVGDSWKKEMTVTNPMPMRFSTTYKLVSVDDKETKLDITSVITAGEGGMEMMDMRIDIDLSGSQTGTAILETPTGMPLSMDTKQDISGKMKPMGQEIPISVLSTTSMKATLLSK